MFPGPLALIPAAWLLPNHYLPWLSAWQDGWAMAMLAVAAIASRLRGTVAPWFLAATGVALVSVLLQAVHGTVFFAGDAWMVALYWLAFVIAWVVGSRLASPAAAAGVESDHLGVFVAAVVVCAMVSVGIALGQWTQTIRLAILVAELPPGGRPFGNVAQPNHLCTIAFLGLCGLAWLFQQRRVGQATLGVSSLVLVLGMVASGSRTAWLQLAVLAGVVLWFRSRAGLRAGFVWLGGVLVAYTLAVAAWPAFNEVLGLSGQRSAEEQFEGSVRLELWRMMIDAVSRRPLLGYGWQQMVLAQQEVALDHPALQRHFEYGHNTAIDLLVWAGIPLGGLILLLLCLGIVSLVRRSRDARAVWLLAPAGGLVAHGLVEHPLAFAYFLIPLGVMLGAASSLASAHRGVRVAPAVGVTLAAVFSLALVITARDYLRAEENFRTFRLESAGVGAGLPRSAAPDLTVLTQLEAFLGYVRITARPGMTDEDLEQMRRVSSRFAYPPAMLRYALAAGLNGQPDVAGRTLQRICAMHARPRCEEAAASWQTLQAQFPVLRGVPAPAVPRHSKHPSPAPG